MKHTRYQLPEYTDAYVHFHNLIEISAQRRTQSQVKEIYMYLPVDQARRIQATLNFMDKFNVKSIGHSAWHIENNKLEPCEYCYTK
jgi:hypothetical protein